MIILNLTITLLVIIFCHAMMLWIEAENKNAYVLRGKRII